jgi:kynurenine formamidase
MLVRFEHHGRTWQADLARPFDLSIALHAGPGQVNCFWAPPVEFEPVVAGSFIGSTAAGGPVNFFNVKFNPHGNGTHTECVGHIARERYVLSQCLQGSHFLARVVSLHPQPTADGDRVLLRAQLKEVVAPGEVEALIVRTLPNGEDKRRRQYSGSNPPYLHHEGAAYLADCGIDHLLLDLPSVDREEDGGALLAHRAFWRYPDAVRRHATITELIYVPDDAPDGYYLLNLQTAAFDLDACPSRPVLFPLLIC